jgi:hypothetical protein
MKNRMEETAVGTHRGPLYVRAAVCAALLMAGYLGWTLYFDSPSPNRGGVVVEAESPGRPGPGEEAEAAGIRVGDRILRWA